MRRSMRLLTTEEHDPVYMQLSSRHSVKVCDSATRRQQDRHCASRDQRGSCMPRPNQSDNVSEEQQTSQSDPTSINFHGNKCKRGEQLEPDCHETKSDEQRHLAADKCERR
jgi:hypothetical protein